MYNKNIIRDKSNNPISSILVLTLFPHILLVKIKEH
jgi:hypothetical protein